MKRDRAETKLFQNCSKWHRKIVPWQKPMTVTIFTFTNQQHIGKVSYLNYWTLNYVVAYSLRIVNHALCDSPYASINVNRFVRAICQKKLNTHHLISTLFFQVKHSLCDKLSVVRFGDTRGDVSAIDVKGSFCFSGWHIEIRRTTFVFSECRYKKCSPYLKWHGNT